MIHETHQVEHLGKSYRFTHGDAFDRGMSDNYYRRPRNPHKGGVGGLSGPRTTELSEQEQADYHAGYDYNDSTGDKKDW